MARQAGARKVYITKMGHGTTFADLVGTFLDTDLDKVGTVEEQFAYHKKWLESVLPSKQ